MFMYGLFVLFLRVWALYVSSLVCKVVCVGEYKQGPGYEFSGVCSSGYRVYLFFRLLRQTFYLGLADKKLFRTDINRKI